MAYDKYGRDRDRYQTRGYGRYYRAPEDYDYDERGFFDRAGDEVRSWFGDEEAERRRRWDARYDERDNDRDDDSRRYASRNRSGYGFDTGPYYGSPYGRGDYEQRSASSGQWMDRGSPYSVREDSRSRFSGRSAFGRERGWGSSTTGDNDYNDWRRRQMEVLDRDYDDYRRERQGRFDDDFGSWRQQRTAQRQYLSQVREHMEVTGSDGQHVGKVDKVKSDRIKLARNDEDAGGRHHYVPCSWVQSVDGTSVRLNRTADQAQQAWQTEEDERQDSDYLTTSGF